MKFLRKIIVTIKTVPSLRNTMQYKNTNILWKELFNTQNTDEENNIQYIKVKAELCYEIP